MPDRRILQPAEPGAGHQREQHGRPTVHSRGRGHRDVGDEATEADQFAVCEVVEPGRAVDQ
ncbi:hypothetical protein SDC9_137861 [bioreactor metagenome]|uniref:Uncharacterized protein n=1 Tax=bioreactor metagenome TaxID=1076179 RepID=A0A645DN90_9ZZZZ